MSANNMPEAEVDIDADLVRALLRDQQPALAELPCEEVGFGWDNVIFRLGDELCVRLPRREVVAKYIVTQMDELLVDDAQLLPQDAQAVADFGQATLDQRPVHQPDHRDGRVPRGGGPGGVRIPA